MCHHFHLHLIVTGHTQKTLKKRLPLSATTLPITEYGRGVEGSIFQAVTLYIYNVTAWNSRWRLAAYFFRATFADFTKPATFDHHCQKAHFKKFTRFLSKMKWTILVANVRANFLKTSAHCRPYLTQFHVLRCALVHCFSVLIIIWLQQSCLGKNNQIN